MLHPGVLSLQTEFFKMVNKTGLSHFLELYKHFGKTEIYYLYTVSNTLSVGSDARKFALLMISISGMGGKGIMHSTRLENKREAGKLYI